jgi:hypothetical protein
MPANRPSTNSSGPGSINSVVVVVDGDVGLTVEVGAAVVVVVGDTVVVEFSGVLIDVVEAAGAGVVPD